MLKPGQTVDLASLLGLVSEQSHLGWPYRGEAGTPWATSTRG
jgi:hypothetical protein